MKRFEGHYFSALLLSNLCALNDSFFLISNLIKLDILFVIRTFIFPNTLSAI